jgi:hypothetical protein
VVCVHGVGQQYKGADVLAAEWVPALRDGLRLAGADEVARSLDTGNVGFAFYGDLFRPSGHRLDVGDPWLTAGDVTDFEAELLAEWWQGAADTDPGVISPRGRTLARVPGSPQAALRALSGSVFFAGVAERALIGDLRQVRLYLNDAEIRRMVQERIAAVVGAGARVLVGHSLGAVAAYEALCAHPEWPVRALLTLGAPLGIRNLIFDRLRPPPTMSEGGLLGQWPGAATAWTNVADAADPVALVKDLRPQFGRQVKSLTVSNGARAHAVSPYLTARETGAAIAAALCGAEDHA